MKQKNLKDKISEIEKQEQELAKKKAAYKKQLIEENNKVIASRKKLTGEIMAAFLQEEFDFDLLELSEDAYSTFLSLIKTEIGNLHNSGNFQIKATESEQMEIHL